MNKKLIILPTLVSILLFNCVTVPVFADTTNNTNHVLSDKADYWKEPIIGYTSYDETEVSNSYYEFVELYVSYTWLNGEWYRCIGINSDGRDTLASDFDFDPYIMKNLPKIGIEGECINFDPFYMYIGDGLRNDKLLKKISELENKINSNHEIN